MFVVNISYDTLLSQLSTLDYHKRFNLIDLRSYLELINTLSKTIIKTDSSLAIYIFAK